MAEDFPEVLALLQAPGERGMLATLVAVEGSSYRRPGARLVAWSDGRRAGAISGGCLEEDILLHGEEVARTGRLKVLEYRTDAEGDPLWGVGTGCEGTVRVVVEPLGREPHPLCQVSKEWILGGLVRAWTSWVGERGGTVLLEPEAPRPAEGFVEDLRPTPALWIFGAGDDARPLASGARWLGWDVHVFDTRPGFLQPKDFPGASLHSVASDRPLICPQPLGPVAAVIMSHRFRDDRQYLQALTARPLDYLGLLGPRKRALRLVGEVAASGEQQQRLLARLRAPIGLHLGGEGARSVALSILAEIQSEWNGGTGRPLRSRDRPIHDAG